MDLKALQNERSHSQDCALFNSIHTKLCREKAAAWVRMRTELSVMELGVSSRVSDYSISPWLMVVLQLYLIFNIHLTEILSWANFIVCK